MGYRPAETPEAPIARPDDAHAGVYSEPFPVRVFGEAKPVLDRDIGKYLTGDVLYYVNIYENNKTFGIPYKNWTEMPEWMIDMHKTFSGVEKEWEYHNLKKQHGV